jgi:hypothetical protein
MGLKIPVQDGVDGGGVDQVDLEATMVRQRIAEIEIKETPAS